MDFNFDTNQESWDKTVLKQDSYFMQSFLWGEFRKKTGISIFRIQDKEAFAQIEKRKLPFGMCYFYLVGHPQIINKKLFQQIKTLAEKENAIFLKIESLHSSKSMKYNIGVKKSINIQPKNTLILDTSLSKEELFKSFHRKHRYNIRLAEKKNIQIKKIETEEGFDNFYKLIKKTDERKHTKSFPKKYYKELFFLSRIKQKSSSSLRVVFLGAYLKNTMVAGLILIVWGKIATYLVGASNYEYRQYMAPHLLQWEAIKLSKKMEAGFYDFWGIIREKEFISKTDFERHRWAGITRFKNGFGGKETKLDNTYDYIFNPIWYKLYQLGIKFK